MSSGDGVTVIRSIQTPRPLTSQKSHLGMVLDRCSISPTGPTAPIRKQHSNMWAESLHFSLDTSTVVKHVLRMMDQQDQSYMTPCANWSVNQWPCSTNGPTTNSIFLDQITSVALFFCRSMIKIRKHIIATDIIALSKR